MTSQYQRGRAFEWEVRDDLEANGYDVVRSAGSKTKIDLVAFKQGQTLIVQAKRSGLESPKERRELLRVAGLINAVPLVAGRKTRPIRVEYKRLTGVGPKEREPWVLDEAGVTA